MKYVSKSQLSIYSLIMAIVVVASGLNGCGKDEGSSTGSDGNAIIQLTVEGIILNPKSPGPGDTLLATAVVMADTTIPGSFANYEWSSTGGAFLETNLSTVRWVAPDTSRAFSLSVTASNSTGSSSASENVFVSRIVPVVASGAGEMHLTKSGDSLIYISSPEPPTSNRFVGFGLRVNSQGVDQEAMATHPRGSFQLVLSNDLSTVAYVVPGTFGGLIQVNYTDLGTQATTVIPNTPFFLRGPQYTEPDFSPDGRLLTYQVWFPDSLTPPSQGGVDSFVVAIWDLATLTEKRVAVQPQLFGTPGTSGLNFHPTFSSDGNHLVYMADPTATGAYELYALPVIGGTVPVDSSTTPLQLTSTGGIMGIGATPARQPTAWNPNPSIPVLATTALDSKLRLVPTDGSGDILVNVFGSALEFVWSPSGQDLVMTTGGTIFRVSSTGGVTQVHAAIAGDALSRLSWSSDEKYLLYSVKRLNDTWYELIDLSGSLGFTDPLRVTPTSPPGDATTYGIIGSISPVWAPSDPTAYMLFFEGSTPRICTMNFGGLSP